MKKNAIAADLRLTAPPLASPHTALTLNPTCPLPHQPIPDTAPKESVRHILLGSPGAIRQTMSLLRRLV